MESAKGRPVGSRVVVLLDLRDVGDGSAAELDRALAELAFELWEAAGVLLRSMSVPPSAEEELVEELALDLLEWDLGGPDWPQ